MTRSTVLSPTIARPFNYRGKFYGGDHVRSYARKNALLEVPQDVVFPQDVVLLHDVVQLASAGS